eukprot:scaffold24655_cov147-Cylindrotheca_fusiformis.AAC.1
MGQENAMKWRHKCSALLFLASTSNVLSDVIAGESVLAPVEQTFPLGEPCVAVVKEIMATVDRATLNCQTPSGRMYSVPQVDTEWIRRREFQGELFSGETELDIPLDTLVDAETYVLQLETPPDLINTLHEEDPLQDYRRLQNLERTTGKKTVLVVRVRATNSVTSISESQLADDVFGDNGDVNNLRSQYLACSYGQLEFQKAKNRRGQTTRIRDGVVTIRTGISTASGDLKMVNTINDKLEREFGTNPKNLADFVMYCLPPGTMHQYDIAYGWMNGYQTVYNDKVCSHVSAQMHELGHNLNLAHSAHGKEEYGDQSGLVGTELCGK